MDPDQEFFAPLLTWKQISMFLGEFMDVALDDLKNKDMNAEKVRSIYEAFMAKLMGIERADLQTPADFTALDSLRHQELHEESVVQIAFFQNLLHLLRSAGVHDAGLTDIVAPSRKRFRRIISKLINLAKFREERVAAFEEFTTSSDQLVELKEQLEQDNAQLTERKTQLQSARELELPAIEKLQQETQQLATSIGTLNTHNETLRGELKTLKQSVTEAEERSAADKFRVAAVKREIATLKSQIVKNPEELKRHLAEMAATVERERDESSEAAVKLRRFQDKDAALKEVAEVLSRTAQDLELAQQQRDKARTAQREAQDVSELVSAMEAALRELCARETHLQQRLQHGQDKLFNLQRDFESKRHAARLSFDTVSTEKQKLVLELSKDKQNMSRIANELSARKAELERQRTTHGTDMKTLQAQYQGLGQQLINFHQSLRTAMRHQAAPAALA